MISIYGTITKINEEDRTVEGYATTDTLDSQGEIITKSAMSAALNDYMKFANLREMHQPKAAGRIVEAKEDKKGIFVKAKIVADDAWKLTKERVYQGFSIGGEALKQVGNKITEMRWIETSLVDRPANPDAIFTLVKLNFNKNEMAKKKDKVVEKPEVVEEVVEAKVDVTVDKGEVQEEVTATEVVVDQIDKSDQIIESLNKIIEKLNQAPAQPKEVEKVDKVEKAVLAKIEDKIASIESKIAELEKIAQPIKAQAGFVDVSRGEGEDSQKAEYKKEYAQIVEKVASYKRDGVTPPSSLVDRGFELVELMK